ncbi:hypothetical protein AOQ84DRAFT_366396 [Glonium stellatum]|uniref:Ankyrin repeat protein n=1 Tax=Glonium stellatum TaxID=574774 RepID=A0A8E2EVP8_9PEZI|nr:hypothetical protein AOQ84DRAFT_366396 [Glonium stellatum]
MVTYLLTLEGEERFSEPKASKILWKAAASNGFENILETLIKRKDAANELLAKNYMVQAKLYNAVRSSREDIFKELQPLAEFDYDSPDYNGCSMLMYAALNGQEHAMEYLIKKGADVNRVSSCQEVNSGRKKGLEVPQDIFEIAASKGYDDISQLLKNHITQTRTPEKHPQSQLGTHDTFESPKGLPASDIEELEDQSDEESSS